MAEETKAVSFLTWRVRIQRIARALRGGSYEDAVQTGWQSTSARRDSDGVRSAIQAAASADRDG